MSVPPADSDFPSTSGGDDAVVPPLKKALKVPEAHTKPPKLSWWARRCTRRQPKVTKKLTEAELAGAIAKIDTLLKQGGVPSATGEHLDFRNKAFPSKDSLQNLDLRAAKFRGAELQGHQFGFANVADADFADADLTDADLSLVKNLQPHQLSGANLSRCKLPADVATFPALTNVAELSKNAGTLFSILLIGCVFVLMVAYTTKDIQMLLDSGTATLPVINLAVNPRLFLGVGPWVLFGQYVTMHLYLQRLWVLLATLPAIFPDGMPLDRKSYPWLLNDLVRAYFPVLNQQKNPLSKTEIVIFRTLSYFVAPMSCFLVMYRCFMRQDWFLYYTQSACIIGFFIMLLIFYKESGDILQRNGGDSLGFGESEKKRFHLGKNTYFLKILGRNIYLLIIFVIFLISMPACISFGYRYFTGKKELKMRGKPFLSEGKPVFVETPGAGKLRHFFTYTWSSFCRGSIAEDTTLQPAEYILPKLLFNEKKGNTDNSAQAWTKRREEKESTLVWQELRAKVKPGNLSHKYLCYLQAREAYLVNADLRSSALDGADFNGATLTGADFGEATLTGANLRSATLTGADLRYAILTGANLRSATLTGADLRSAILNNADFTGANLTGADIGYGKDGDESATLIGANLSSATLIGANLSFATLTGANLSSAKLNWGDLKGATLTGAYLNQATLTDANLRSATLTNSDLIGATLTNADLTRATLTNADLTGAILTNADLRGATLKGTHLNQAVLTNANLRGAALTGAYLNQATLTNADLKGADLSTAHFLETVRDLDEVVFSPETKWSKGWKNPPPGYKVRSVPMPRLKKIAEQEHIDEAELAKTLRMLERIKPSKQSK